MSRPPINPKKTAAGIAVDPRTLERVIPESRRQDGSVRKEIKIRPGFTPQEDVNLFRTKRQAQIEANTLPKGHIIGWAPQLSSSAEKSPTAPLSKSAKKNAKRKEKRVEKLEIKDNWEDDDVDDPPVLNAGQNARSTNDQHTTDRPNWAVAAKEEKKDNSNIVARLEGDPSATDTDELSKSLAKLDVQ